MESTTSRTGTSRSRDDVRERERDHRALSADRAWLQAKGRLLDEQAFLAALGRGGAQRMAIPLGHG